MVPRLVSGRPSGVAGSGLVTTTAAARARPSSSSQLTVNLSAPSLCTEVVRGARPLGAHSQALCSCERLGCLVSARRWSRGFSKSLLRMTPPSKASVASTWVG
jgi:hypothetical protein